MVWCIVSDLPRQVLHNHYLTSSHLTPSHLTSSLFTPSYLLSLHLISYHFILSHSISSHCISYDFITSHCCYFCLQWDCGNSRALSTEWECRQFLNAGKMSRLFTAFSSPFWCTSLLEIHPHTTILISFLKFTALPLISQCNQFE